eukprot:g5052.t1
MCNSVFDSHLFRKAKEQCIGLIFHVVEKQRLPFSIATTGSLLLQRFYETQPLTEHDRFVVTVACCCLAAKIEFRSMSLKDLVFSCLTERYDRNKQPEKFTEEAILEFRRTVHRVEQILLLDVLNFDFNLVQGPHSALAEVLASMETESLLDLHQLTWTLANDSSYTTLSLEFPQNLVAYGIIDIAVEKLEVKDIDVALLWKNTENWKEIRNEIRSQLLSLYTNRKESL